MKELLRLLTNKEFNAAAIARWIEQYGDQLLTRMPQGHFTASGLILNPARTKTLMVYHNIYRSYAWTGGHADGDHDLLAVALREAEEETGARCRPIDGTVCAADILPVPEHIKRGQRIAAHVHLNYAFALECDDDASLRIKPDENSAVGWIDVDDLPRHISLQDAHMLPIYQRILEKYCR